MAYFEYNLAGLGLGAVLEPKKAMRLILIRKNSNPKKPGTDQITKKG